MKLLKKLFTFIAWGFAALTAFLMFSAVAFVFVIFEKGVGEEEASVSNIKGDNAIGVLPLKGEIITSDKFRRELKKFVKNDKINAIVVRIESPGGSVGASEEIYRAIREAAKKKPVVCSLGNVAASGGLYAAVACDKIVLNAGTLTGSIGVIMMMPNVASLIDSYGIEMNVIKSGPFKDSGSPFRQFEQRDRSLIQSLVDAAYQQFITAISVTRKLDIAKVHQFADGRIILGQQAVELGLADLIGGLSEAAKLALTMAKPGTEEEPELIRPKKRRGFMSVLDEVSEAKIFTWLKNLGRARLLYQASL